MKLKMEMTFEEIQFSKYLDELCSVDATLVFDWDKGSAGDWTTPPVRAHAVYERVQIERVEFENGKVLVWDQVFGMPRERILDIVERRIQSHVEDYENAVRLKEMGY